MIINDALSGLQRTGTRYAMEPERKKGIALAIHEARPGDIVLLAGKGHKKSKSPAVVLPPLTMLRLRGTFSLNWASIALPSHRQVPQGVARETVLSAHCRPVVGNR